MLRRVFISWRGASWTFPSSDVLAFVHPDIPSLIFVSPLRVSFVFSLSSLSFACCSSRRLDSSFLSCKVLW